jgi:hypothetical protein
MLLVLDPSTGACEIEPAGREVLCPCSIASRSVTCAPRAWRWPVWPEGRSSDFSDCSDPHGRAWRRGTLLFSRTPLEGFPFEECTATGMRVVGTAGQVERPEPVPRAWTTVPSSVSGPRERLERGSRHQWSATGSPSPRSGPSRSPRRSRPRSPEGIDRPGPGRSGSGAAPDPLR